MGLFGGEEKKSWLHEFGKSRRTNERRMKNMRERGNRKKKRASKPPQENPPNTWSLW